ncbi:hypothetical protein LCGC14_2098560 [marine sediment metagenome]|uniref:Uncharacterized protein n=1 Tax=marine sediment metagenome TaxID=412755 RepID=A0A0F9GNS5_9ZZZZ
MFFIQLEGQYVHNPLSGLAIPLGRDTPLLSGFNDFLVATKDILLLVSCQSVRPDFDRNGTFGVFSLWSCMTRQVRLAPPEGLRCPLSP